MFPSYNQEHGAYKTQYVGAKENRIHVNNQSNTGTGNPQHGIVVLLRFKVRLCCITRIARLRKGE